jgi:hypothetical protein
MTKKPNEPVDPTDTSHPLYDPAKDPTHPFYEEDKAEGEPKPASPDGAAYKVGPGYPPKQYTWKKGGPSPYPKGRPKKVASMEPDLKKALEAALNEKVVITKDKKEIVLTKAALGIQQLVNQFAKGDRYARRDLFQYAAQLGVDLQAKDLITEALGLNDQAIVDAFLRRQQQASLEPAPDDHVKAPPDLVDDDVAMSQPGASPQSDMPATQPVEPGRDDHGRPKPAMSVSDLEYIKAARARNLAQQKKNQSES